MDRPTRISIASEADIVFARASGRTLADALGFGTVDATVIATAISEVARNIVHYAGQGEMEMDVIRASERQGLRIVARDQGPGMRDISQAMQPGYSTENSLGLGLPGARRLMDDFEIHTEYGRGTTVTMTKWKR